MLRIALLLSTVTLPVLANDYWETVFQATEEARRRAQQIHQPIQAPKSSSFGLRFHPILNIDRLHRGVDFAAEQGTPFKSAGRGEVLYAEERGDLGLTVAIKHTNGVVTRYGHASELMVMQGDIVDAETVIGLVGQTGVALGPHLHFEAIVNGEYVDPTKITTLYDPNMENATLDERINMLLSSQQRSIIDSTPNQKPLNLPVKQPSDPLVTPPDPQLIADIVTLSEAQQGTELTSVLNDPKVEPSGLSTHASGASAAQSQNTNSREDEPTLKITSADDVSAKLPRTTWGIAEMLIKDTDLTIFQALSALVEINPKSFKNSNVHIRYADSPLTLPTLEQMKIHDHGVARTKYYDDLEKLSPSSSTADEE